MPETDARMTFTEHLAELRTRIIRAGVALVVCVVICFFLYDQLFALVSRPLQPLQEREIIVFQEDEDDPDTQPPPEGETEPAPDEDAESPSDGETKPAKGESDSLWLILNPLEPFLVNLKLAGYGGVILALPYIVFQMCAFIFPGLKPNEKQAVRILLFGCSLFVVLGITVAYFGVFPLVLPYLMEYAPEGVRLQLRLSETVTLILKGLMGFAIAFQFPMVVFVLVYLELITPATLKRWRREVIIGLAFLSAMLTPPDPPSMLLMAGPLVLLYEVSIWISYVVVWRKKRRAAGTA